MRHVKPQVAATITRPFEFGGRFHLGVSVLLLTGLDEQPRLFTEQELWAFWAQQPEGGEPLEEGIPRSGGEYLVLGAAHPPEAPQPACRVKAEVGGLRKELVVWGRRYWQDGRISTPEPFTNLRLGWRLAYGGPGHAQNPEGMGHATVEEGGHRILPLPQVEYPDAPWTLPGQAIQPAGFGPLDVLHPLRQSRSGTYDTRWFQHEYPAVAHDTDWRFFNRAPDDQSQPHPFRGDEPYRFTHLHPAKPHLEGRLPGLCVRVFATRSGDDKRPEELDMRLTALWFFPDAERVIQVFQGTLPVAEDDASDVVHLLTAVERLGRRRPRQHYQAVRDKRLDRDKGLLEALRESDLVPEDLVIPLVEFPDEDGPSIAHARAEARARREREAARAFVVSHGWNPDTFAPKVEAGKPPRIRSLDDLLSLTERVDKELAELPARAEVEKHRQIEEAVPLMAAEHEDAERWIAALRGEAGLAPPSPFAEPLLQELKTLAARQPDNSAAQREILEITEDPQRLLHWRKAEQAQAEGYRASSHTLPLPARRGAEESAALREDLRLRLTRGESLSGIDLSGADLAGLDLSGADLRKAFLNGTDLSTANLEGADLRGATLAHARLIGTRLKHCRLQEANLGAGRLEGTDLSGADLREAVFDGARLRHASLRGARLDGSRWLDVKLEQVDLSKSTSTVMLVFIKADFSHCQLQNIQWAQTIFQECRMKGVLLAGARFDKVVFQGADLRGADLRGLRIGSGCFVQACTLRGADLRRVDFREISLRGCDLSTCDFREATLRSCDLSECDLRESRFYGADLRGASLVRARLQGADFYGCNLMEACLQHARMDNTDFRFSNLHASDWARVQLGPGVSTEGALASRIRTRPRRHPERDEQ